MRKPTCLPNYGFNLFGPKPRMSGLEMGITTAVGMLADIACVSILDNSIKNGKLKSASYNGRYIDYIGVNNNTFNLEGLYSGCSGTTYYNTFNLGGDSVSFSSIPKTVNNTFTITIGGSGSSSGAVVTPAVESDEDDDGTVNGTKKDEKTDSNPAAQKPDNTSTTQNNGQTAGGAAAASNAANQNGGNQQGTKYDVTNTAAFNNLIDDLTSDGKNEEMHSARHSNKHDFGGGQHTKDTVSEEVDEKADEKGKEAIKNGIKRGIAKGDYPEGENAETKASTGHYKYITLTDKDSGNEYTYTFESCDANGLKYKLDRDHSNITKEGWKDANNGDVFVTVTVDEQGVIQLTSDTTSYSAAKGKASGGGAPAPKDPAGEEEVSPSSKYVSKSGRFRQGDATVSANGISYNNGNAIFDENNADDARMNLNGNQYNIKVDGANWYNWVDRTVDYSDLTDSSDSYGAIGSDGLFDPGSKLFNDHNAKIYLSGQYITNNSFDLSGCTVEAREKSDDNKKVVVVIKDGQCYDLNILLTTGDTEQAKVKCKAG